MEKMLDKQMGSGEMLQMKVHVAALLSPNGLLEDSRLPAGPAGICLSQGTERHL